MKTVTPFIIGVMITACLFICVGSTTSIHQYKFREYKIVEAENRMEELEREVQSEMNSGWTPIGGVSITELPRGGTKLVYLHQAMVK